MFKILSRQVSPPAGVQSPLRWGVEADLRKLFESQIGAIHITSRMFNFRYRSAAHFIDVFRSWYGPVHKAYASLPPDKAAVLSKELTEALNERNRGGAGSLVVPGEYLEIVITRR